MKYILARKNYQLIHLYTGFSFSLSLPPSGDYNVNQFTPRPSTTFIRGCNCLYPITTWLQFVCLSTETSNFMHMLPGSAFQAHSFQIQQRYIQLVLCSPHLTSLFQILFSMRLSLASRWQDKAQTLEFEWQPQRSPTTPNFLSEWQSLKPNSWPHSCKANY